MSSRGIFVVEVAQCLDWNQRLVDSVGFAVGPTLEGLFAVVKIVLAVAASVVVLPDFWVLADAAAAAKTDQVEMKPVWAVLLDVDAARVEGNLLQKDSQVHALRLVPYSSFVWSRPAVAARSLHEVSEPENFVLFAAVVPKERQIEEVISAVTGLEN